MPKIIRVDENDAEVEKETDIDWVYRNTDGEDERVRYSTGKSVSILDASYEEICIYIEDIPNLIKALQAAYKYITNS